MEDMKARLKIMEANTATSEEQPDRANEENVIQREASQKVETKTDKAINFEADVSK